MEQLNRNYNANSGVKSTELSLTRNLITQEAKKVFLERQFKPKFASDIEPKVLEAIDEGNLNSNLSLFGLPVWDVIEFRYQDLTPVKLSIATVEVTQSRNIITTAVQGLDGTIKEYISDGDALIKIRATIVGDAQDYYPGEEITALNGMFSIKDAINVFSTVLNKYFNINSIVVTEYSFSQPEAGMRNVQTLDLTCLSDSPGIYDIIMLVQ